MSMDDIDIGVVELDEDMSIVEVADAAVDVVDDISMVDVISATIKGPRAGKQ